MITIIMNDKGYHVVNTTLGAVIATYDNLHEALKLKTKILS